MNAFHHTRKPGLGLVARLGLLAGALVLSVALAAPLSLTVQLTTSGFALRADGVVRYYVDPTTRTLVIPEAALAPGTVLPAGVTLTAREGGLVLTLDAPFGVSLSPDGRAVSVQRVMPDAASLAPSLLTPPATAGTAPADGTAGAAEAAKVDERMPVVYRLANASPAQVAGLLTRMYNLRVEVDERQRALLVLVNATDRALVDALVKQLDLARPQVMFEAEILEVNQDLTQSLGIQWDSIFTFRLTEGEVPGMLKLGTVSRSPFSLSFGINLLKTSGAARVLARPRIATLDGLEAKLNATQTTPIIVPASNGTQSVQNITTGITLTMLPKVAPDGTIEARLTISVSSPTGTTAQGVPQFSSREASTTVRVGNGEPISIGGLLETRKIEGVSKVPGLGDIPLLGELFTSRRTEERSTDLVIVVTPRIVVPVDGPPPAPEEEREPVFPQDFK